MLDEISQLAPLEQLKQLLEQQIKTLPLDTLPQERTIFQSEYDRIIFSDYFRALSLKTQVVPSPKNDYTHTRLTHSLEVASLGFDFAKRIIKKMEIPHDSPLNDLPLSVATACLVHDIGNPPFGHSGEEAIQQFFKNNFDNVDFRYKETSLKIDELALKEFLYFDGNAYGFRVLTRLAGSGPLYSSAKDSATGAKLSAFTLNVYSKYPFAAGEYPAKSEKKKFGYFSSEKDIFEKAVSDLGWEKGRRHPLTYLVEAADDICYFIMDCEDAIKSGHLRFRGEELTDFCKDQNERVELHKHIANIKRYDPNLPLDYSHLKSIEKIRSTVIRHYFQRATSAFHENLEAILEGDMDISLFEKIFDEKGLEAYEEFKKEKLSGSLYIHQRKMTMELSGRKVIQELLHLFMDALSEYLDHNFPEDQEDLPETKEGLTTHTRHLLRFLGIEAHETFLRPLEKKPTQLGQHLCMIALDFIVKHSDEELIRLHKRFTDFSLYEG